MIYGIPTYEQQTLFIYKYIPIYLSVYVIYFRQTLNSVKISLII